MSRWKILKGVHYDKYAKPIELVDNRTDSKKEEDKLRGITRDIKDFNPAIHGPEGKESFPYYPGDIFESDKDLRELNVRGMPPRFQEVDGGPVDELDGMTVAQLREFAEAEEIEVPGSLRKEQLLKAIRGKLDYEEAVTS